MTMTQSQSKNGTSEQSSDSLSQLQRKIDDIGVMFYTYVGIIQRDAPPTERASDKADSLANNQKLRKELAEKTPEFAKDIGTYLKQSIEINSHKSTSHLI